jgi:hypothetical protein
MLGRKTRSFKRCEIDASNNTQARDHAAILELSTSTLQGNGKVRIGLRMVLN